MERSSPDRSGNQWVLPALLLFAFVVRVRTLQNVFAGGDPFEYMLAVKHLLHGLPAEQWVWTHHTARFGLIGPATAVHWLFGEHVLTYYATPMLMSLALTGLTYAVCRRVHSEQLGIVSAVTVAVFPMMLRNGCQLAPGVFSATYLMLATYGLARYASAQTPRATWAWLGLISAAAFAAWLTKVDNAFALPGLVIGVLLVKRRLLHAATVAAAVVALLFFEWGLYAAFSEVEGGRLGIIRSTHLTSRKLKPIEGLSSFMVRYAVLEAYWYYVLGLAVVAWGWHAARVRRVPQVFAITLGGLTFLVGLTFAVKSLDPLTPAAPRRSRYLFAALPFMVIAIWAFVLQLWNVAPRYQLTRWYRVQLGMVLALLSVLVYPKRWRHLERHPMRVAFEHQRLATRAQEENQPIVAHGRDTRAMMKGFQALYWSGYERGELPRFRRARVDGLSVLYVYGSDTPWRPGTLKRHAEEGKPVLRVLRLTEKDVTLRRGSRPVLGLRMEVMKPEE